jgi:hypothetical protein
MTIMLYIDDVVVTDNNANTIPFVFTGSTTFIYLFLYIDDIVVTDNNASFPRNSFSVFIVNLPQNTWILKLFSWS